MTPKERLQQLDAAMDALVEEDPELARLWVEQHPAHLQMMVGMTVEPFHVQAFEDVLEHPENLWLAPRGSGKSTSHGVCFPAWLAVAQPENMREDIRLFADAVRKVHPGNIRVALTSNSQDRAVAMHRQIQQILTHRRVAVLFGNLVGDRWKDSDSTTRFRVEERDRASYRESTFTCLGLGSKVAGGHYDVVVADDWVTEDNARTELQRSRLQDFWAFTVRGTLEPWARVVVCGTRYHPADWYSTLVEWTKQGLWGNVSRTPAITEENGERTSYWPEAYSLEKLDQIRDQIGAIAFATQFQNETDMMLGDFFAQEHVENFAKWAEVSAQDRGKARTVISLDPAIKGGPRNDYSVFTVVSYIAPYFYVRRVARGQWTNTEQVAVAEGLCARYSPVTLGVEVVGGIEWLVNDLKQANLGCRVLPLRPQQMKGKDKVGRASHVRKFFEKLLVFIESPQSPEAGTARLLEEMMAFPNASTQAGMDDCVDSLVWALVMLSTSRTRLRRSH